jgi:hypothetical protein
MNQRSREEILPELLPIRRDLIAMAEHLNDQHGIRPENRDITDPRQMPEQSLRFWARRMGLGSFLEDDEQAVRSWADSRQQSCSTAGCPGVDELMRMWGIARERVEVLTLELPPDDPTAGPQTITPIGLSTDVVTGWQQRY